MDIVFSMNFDAHLYPNSIGVGAELLDNPELFLYTLAKKIALSPYKIVVLEKSLEGYAKRLKTLCDDISLRIQEVGDYGILRVQNILKNSELLTRGLSGALLKDRFLGQVAIVCGAASSLEAAIPFIQEGKGIILSASSATRFLESKGIIPDFIGVLDPQALLTKIGSQALLKSSVITTLSANADVLKASIGPLFFFAPKEELDMESFIYERVWDKTARLSRGWTVVDFLIEAAEFMGCSRVFLVGVDLCYDKGKKYVDGDFLEGCSQNDWERSALWLKEKSKVLSLSRIGKNSKFLDLPAMSVQDAIELLTDEPKVQECSFALGNEPSNFQEIRVALFLSFQRVQEGVKGILEFTPKDHPLVAVLESDLEQEFFYRAILEPIWDRWKEVLCEGGVESSFKKYAFFDRVILDYVKKGVICL